jgi:hypothetical protein
MPPVDDDLRARLAVLPAPAVDVDADLAAVRARANCRRGRRRVVAVALVVLALVVAGGIGALVSTDDDVARRSIVADPAPAPFSTAPPTTRLPPDVAMIPSSAMDAFPGPEGSGATLALGDGSVWVGGFPSDAARCHLGCGRITRFDATSGAVEATITVPKYPRALAFGFGALWAEVEVPDGAAALVVKVDPATNQVVAQAEIPDIAVVGSTGHPKLAVGAGAVWSLYGDELTKFDPHTGAVVGNVRLDGQYFDGGIVANDAGVWLVGQQVMAIDPPTLAPRQIATVDLGYIQSAALDGGTIWLTEAHGGAAGVTEPMIELVKVDTASGHVTSTGIPTANVAAGAGRVWFQGFAGAKLGDTYPDDVVEIDPVSTRMLRAATVGLNALRPPLLVVDRDAVWLLTGSGLLRIRA